MSWWLSVPQCLAGDFEKTANQALEDQMAADPGSWPAENVDHAHAAIAAAALMAQAVAPSDLQHELIVSMGGHANAMHHPTPGYMNDTLNVTVTQTNVQSPVEVPPPLPSADNPIPVEQAVEAAPVWEGQVPTTEVPAEETTSAKK